MLLLLPLSVELLAQGEWKPIGAVFDRPRLITTSSEIDVLRDKLDSENSQHAATLRKIFTRLYHDNATRGWPRDSLSTSTRLRNAAFAKNAAFLLLLNRGVSDGAIVPMDSNVRSKLQRNLEYSLGNINQSINPVSEYQEWQWRTREIIDYLAAYDIAIAIDVDSNLIVGVRSKLQEAVSRLYQYSTTEDTGFSFFSRVRNNHALMVCGALGTAAIVLNESSGPASKDQAASWMHTALTRSDSLLWTADDRLSDPDQISGYAEGPYYLRHAMQNLLPFWRGLKNVIDTDSIDVVLLSGEARRLRHPFHAEGTLHLASWIWRITTPDGLLPTIGDTYADQAFPEIALLGISEYVHPIESRYIELADALVSTVDMRSNFLAAGTTPWLYVTDPPFPQGPIPTVMPHAGIALLQDRILPGLQIGVTARNGLNRSSAGLHGQSDAASFFINYGSNRLALDPGYISLDRRDEVDGAQHHNSILINGEGPPAASPGRPAGADAFFVDSFRFPGRLDEELEGVEVETMYGDAEIRRFFVRIGSHLVIIADEINSNFESESTWQLHGIDARRSPEDTIPRFSYSPMKQGGLWASDVGSMTALVIAEDSNTLYSYARDSHDIGYNRTAEHVVLRVTSPPATSTKFLSAVSVGNISERSMTHSRDSNSLMVGISHRSQSPHYWSLARTGGDRDIIIDYFPWEFSTDARMIGFQDGSPLTYMAMIGGSQLTAKSSGRVMLSADSISNMVVLNHRDYETKILVNRAGTFTVYLPWNTINPSVFPQEALIQWNIEKIDNLRASLTFTVDRATTVTVATITSVQQLNHSNRTDLDLSTTNE